MNKKTILTVISIFLITFCLAENKIKKTSARQSPVKKYKRKTPETREEINILVKRARSFQNRRNYEKANKLYFEILKISPNHENSIINIINNYIKMKQTKKAEKFLIERTNSLPSKLFTGTKASILLDKNKLSEAIDLINDYLKKNKNSDYYLKDYKYFAQLYENFFQYEEAEKLYSEAEKISGNKRLFALESARLYEKSGNWEKSLTEYLSYTEVHKNYQYLVASKVKNALKSDSTLINLIEEKIKGSEKNYMLEILAKAYIQTNKIEKALAVYATLKPSTVLKTAEQYKSEKNYKIALKAYELYGEITNNPENILETKYNLAEIYFNMNQSDKSFAYAEEIINSKKFNSRRMKYRKNYNYKIRMLKAEISLLRKEPLEKIISQIKEAEKYAANSVYVYNSTLKIISLNLASEKFDTVEKQIKKLMSSDNLPEYIRDKAFYYKYLLSLYQNSPEDSLLTELLVKIPESELTSNALQLTDFVKNADDSLKSVFLKATRKVTLKSTLEAYDLINSIEFKPESEIFYLVCADWLIDGGYANRAIEFLTKDYSNSALKAYAVLKLNKISDNHKKSGREFLIETPDSVFSPSLRNYVL